MMNPDEWQIVWLSLRIAAAAVLLVLIPGIYLAYVLARTKSPVRFVVDNLVQLPLVLPPVVTGYLLLYILSPTSATGAWLQSMGIRIPFTWFGAALAAGIVALPFIVQTTRVAFEAIDSELEEAVQVAGGGQWAILRLVWFPMSMKGIAAAIVLGFARAFGEFGATIVLAGNIPGTTRTVPLAIYTALNRIGADGTVARLVTFAVVVSFISLALHWWLTRRL